MNKPQMLTLFIYFIQQNSACVRARAHTHAHIYIYRNLIPALPTTGPLLGDRPVTDAFMVARSWQDSFNRTNYHNVKLYHAIYTVSKLATVLLVMTVD